MFASATAAHNFFGLASWCPDNDISGLMCQQNCVSEWPPVITPRVEEGENAGIEKKRERQCFMCLNGRTTTIFIESCSFHGILKKKVLKLTRNFSKWVQVYFICFPENLKSWSFEHTCSKVRGVIYPPPRLIDSDLRWGHIQMFLDWDIYKGRGYFFAIL